MNRYEIMFIVKTTIDTDEVSKTVETLKQTLTDRKASLENFKDLGQKKLAYEIKKEVNGFYYIINALATSDAIAEFDRKALISENVIRHLIINLDKE